MKINHSDEIAALNVYVLFTEINDPKKVINWKYSWFKVIKIHSLNSLSFINLKCIHGIKYYDIINILKQKDVPGAYLKVQTKYFYLHDGNNDNEGF